DRLQEVSELGADERIAAERQLVIVELHPVADRVGAVRVDEERCVEHFAADDRGAGGEDAANLAEHALRRGDVLEDPAEECAVERLGLDLEARGVHLENVVARLPRLAARPRDGREEALGFGDLLVVDLDAGDVDLGEVAEEDLRLRADAAANLEKAPSP